MEKKGFYFYFSRGRMLHFMEKVQSGLFQIVKVLKHFTMLLSTLAFATK
jgi:hypothetical protein